MKTFLDNLCVRYYKTHEAWLKERKIGGSSIAMLFDKSPWGTPLSLWLGLTGQTEEKQENDRMKEGRETESSICNLFVHDFAAEMELHIAPPKRGAWMFYRPDKPYITCTPDGLCMMKGGALWGTEFKNAEVRGTLSKETWNKGLPDQYFFQAIGYLLAIPQLDGVILYAHLKFYENYGGVWKFDHAEDRPYIIRRSDSSTADIIEAAERKATDFWENNVVKHIPPKTVITW